MRIKNNMKISVVIPAYNEEKTIADTLSHVMNQSRPADEVIVVDNNCTDATASIAKKLGARVIVEKTQGMTPARNAGFNAAKGEVIARTDADTHVPHDWIERIERSFHENDELVGLSGPIVYYDLKVNDTQIALLARIYRHTCKLIYGNEIMIGPNYALRKDTWLKIAKDVCMDDHHTHEDIDISIHLSEFGLVHFDKKLIVRTSGRRIKNNPSSFFFEYTQKHFPMIKSHKIKPMLSKIGSLAESDDQT